MRPGTLGQALRERDRARRLAAIRALMRRCILRRLARRILFPWRAA